MKTQFALRNARALAPLLVATALFSTPAFAQDATPQTAPAQPVVTPEIAARQQDSLPMTAMNLQSRA